MKVELGCFAVELVGGSCGVAGWWQAVFAPFLRKQAANPISCELVGVAEFSRRQTALFLGDDFTLFAERPFFTDPSSQLSVYTAGAGQFVLVFPDAAVVQASVAGAGQIRGLVHERALTNGRLEDILYTSLASILRRRGIYLVHAFAAEKNGRCVLIVGPPGSGKTTAGLSLLQAGWHHLSNDVTLITQSANSVIAWPTPGYFGIRSHTFDLLPHRGLEPGNMSTDQVLHRLNGRFGSPAAVTHLIFPQVTAQAATTLTDLPAAIGWSRLMAESMDCWDQEALSGHMAVLKAVCVETAVFTLQSGHDIRHLDQLLQPTNENLGSSGIQGVDN